MPVSAKSFEALDKLLSSIDDDGSTALHTAVKKEEFNFVKFLLAAEIDTKKKDKEGRTALYYAAQIGSTKLMTLLIGTKKDSRIPKAAWAYIEEHSVKEFSKALLAGGPFPWEKTGNDFVQLAKRGTAETVEKWLRVNPKFISHVFDGSTALHNAARSGNTQVVEVLVGYPGILNIKDGNGYTAIQLAAGSGHIDVVKALLRAGAETLETPTAMSPLRLAADGEYAGIVQLLLRSGVSHEGIPDGLSSSYERIGRRWDPAFHAAAAKGYLAVVEVFLNEKVDPNLGGYHRQTPLHKAAGRGQDLVVEALLRAKADVTRKDADGNTPLHLAALGPHVNIVKRLLAVNSEQGYVNMINNSKNTALQMAVAHRDWTRNDVRSQASVVQHLVNAKADILVRGYYWGETTLIAAAKISCEVRLLKILVEANVSVTAVDKSGDTALHHAVRSRELGNVQYLLDVGADVNAKNVEGSTPLHCAIPTAREQQCRTGECLIYEANTIERIPAIITMLLDAMADVTAVNTKNLTPAQCAEEVGSMDLVGIINEAAQKRAAAVVAKSPRIVKRKRSNDMPAQGNKRLRQLVDSGCS